MTTRLALSAFLTGALAAGIAAAPAAAQDQHVVVTPQEIEWQPGPASLPPGSEMAVLYGTPGEEGPFSMRLRLPGGYEIPPHTHPRPEIVTVLSGTFHIGTGETADRAEATALPDGGFFGFSPGMAHFAYTDEETVIQLNSVGPWEIEYIDPADDPRQSG